jgi:serine/threonine-protein kinase
LCQYLKARPADAPAPHAHAHAFDAAQLQHIERQLAAYIGPLAKHLVKTAALSAAGPDDLLERLAAELDTETERREFASRCRRA